MIDGKTYVLLSSVKLRDEKLVKIIKDKVLPKTYYMFAKEELQNICEKLIKT
jgi:hypothetical protein